MSTIASAFGVRIAAEFPCVAGVVCAAILAYADKSPWVWSWFLIFAACNIVTGQSVKETITTKSARPATET